MVTKAVFPVAGFGTRFLPATKAMPKELLPILDKPLIQYAAEEAVKAGIDTLIFVTGKNKRAIEDHFDSNFELETALIEKGKIEESEMIKNILPKSVQCVFVRQHKQLGLGHAILCAEKVVRDDPFALILADDFITPTSKGLVADLVKKFKASGKIQLTAMPVDGPDISKYGVLELCETAGRVAGLIEKPTISDAPSNLASIGRYVLTSSIFDILKNTSPDKGGEIQLTDAINFKAKMGEVEYMLLKGKRFDCGSVEGFFDAIFNEAKTRGYSK